LLPILEAPLELTFGMTCGRIAVVPEFQGRPGDDALIVAISFQEKGRNEKGPNQASDQPFDAGIKSPRNVPESEAQLDAKACAFMSHITTFTVRLKNIL
jgi:hypothetical protein